MLTIDLFTTPKPFLELTAVHQANALRSWRGCPHVRRIFVFGAVSGDTAAIVETGSEVILDVECTANGLPSIRSMFEIAAERSTADLLMFTNADMIYLPSFFEGVEACGEMAGERFLLVGSRMDFDSEQEFTFASAGEIASFEAHTKPVARLHPPAGSDYFIFPRRQYLENRLPDLWIGRGGWDLFMIYHAKEQGILTVDLSPSVLGFHQNHDYGIRGKEAGVPYDQDPQAAYNLSLLPPGIPWSHWTLRGCAKEWTDGTLEEKDGIGKRRRGKDRNRAKRKAGKRRGKAGFVTRFSALVKRIFGMADAKARRPKPEKGKRAGGRPIRRLLQSAVQRGEPTRIVVGAGHTEYEGWLSTNIDTLDLRSEEDWKKQVGETRLDRVLAEHVWEHLTPADGITALKHIADHLKPGGIVRIAVPDGNHPDREYIEHVRPGGKGAGADDHKILYTVAILDGAMREAGLVPTVLEYWDEKGEFHAIDWDPADGMIRRSLRFDPRNAGGRPVYTSLIVDGVKAPKAG